MNHHYAQSILAAVLLGCSTLSVAAADNTTFCPPHADVTALASKIGKEQNASIQYDGHTWKFSNPRSDCSILVGNNSKERDAQGELERICHYSCGRDVGVLIGTPQ